MALSPTSIQRREDSKRSAKTNFRPSLDCPEQTRALLSIKPTYAEAIFRGDKRFEYRRAIFRKQVNVVVVYTTSPVCRVVGEFEVKEIITDTVEALWSRTKNSAGIARDHFFDYFSGCDAGYAIAIGAVRSYPEPLDLSLTFGVRPPQSFLYLA